LQNYKIKDEFALYGTIVPVTVPMKTWILPFASYKEKDDIFNEIISGRKTIETRPINPASSKNYATVQVGDMLVFESNDSHRIIEKTVVFVHPYKSVYEMVAAENEESILPGIGSKGKLLERYEIFKKLWGNTYKEKLETHGIVAIGFT
jgi:ASC-1-like (ASCH) protein